MSDIQWYPGHMAKTKRLIKENLNLVDIIVEVADARIPQSSRNPDFARLIGDKPRVIVLNKKDLAEEVMTREWVDYFNSRGHGAVPVNGAQKVGIRELTAAVKSGAEPVMQKLAAKGRRRRPVRVMIIGIPNVGKSTIINAMVNKASTKTANKPGVTKGPQWVRVMEGIDLLDTPGLLWPKFEDQETGFKLAITGSISDLVYPLEEVAKKLVAYLAARNPAALMERYNLDRLTDDPEKNMALIGKKRGFLGPGGMIKKNQTSVMLLQEFRNGKLGRYTLERPE